ncbi:MAG: 2,3,4,5-tetrahydropyridine-2,6-dicarboxylate N-succinyltransferase [Candidatus Eisenbacteria bacterium]|uniref:2,3,4,5-tetrahydropyridine-2,6-dicarboxylate N-succinyltransferase n=1 Tax=Eiseniibacteriota bacterium TaxID=2212470 RepID=A0A948W8B9_UNCEI|nr:2,3,4,5-tetrahydropyridine-2,6-dicarboxylate N-succinyltransferase [Candidatus Eisenbacteria bacterium]MBU1950480.1 2,3,4,5-tetrahydropyridine-2,6-dicarboxylate N-succinyltransferase [Candidatus Eisenbacteria bacterium]MBU2692531.1 2,3,4,5-tetrahydropyridine-2,6-dicarboxylate N-succinyltransferase [Candidatus Eisenbacteria bacterium]
MSLKRSALKEIIERAWEQPKQRRGRNVIQAVRETIALLDAGKIRVASPRGRGWIVNHWVKEAILLYFLHQEVEQIELGPFTFRDKIPLKTDLEKAGVRVAPPGTVRYGAHLEPDVVLMPGYVNIGAYVGTGSMIDTWATVGSCAQVGRYVHVSGGVGIGGVLEPIQADPVIIEDGVFLGSRCVLVEGVRIGREAVLGAGVVLTASTPIVDVRGKEPKTMRGFVPPRAVVVPGSQPRTFRAGIYSMPCALIIGERRASTDAKTALNDFLRNRRREG